jgi:hypothetical protein
MIHLEAQYIARVESLDKNDLPDVETVYHAAVEIFQNHWILYVMDTMLWEAYRAEKPHDAMEHQRNRIDYHAHYYNRPTFIFAWCHEELGDAIQNQFPHRKWQSKQEFVRAYHMLAILCGRTHHYSASPYQKLLQADQMSGH